MIKRTKIVATVGPASGSPERLRQVAEAGVDVFRINFSHGNEEQRSEFFENIRTVERQIGRPLAICGDLCGPKIRVGLIAGGEVNLEAGRTIIIQRAPIEGTAERISTTLTELVDLVRAGETILLADGRLRFEVVQTAPPEQFTCRIVVGGPLSSGNGVNVPDTELPLSALTEKDRQDIRWTAEHDVDYVALSFVRRAQDVNELRALLEAQGSHAQIIVKIEKPQALNQIDAIIDTADAVMVARGDLGVEMDFPAVPIAQKTIARKCQAAGKPCIIATEMLESMTRSPRPTRAEASDVANAVFDHTDAVMLSAESAIGSYPVEAVDAMKRIVLAAERFLDRNHDSDPAVSTEPKTAAALAASVHQIMQMQPIAAIAVFSATGTTARLLAKNRPNCPIIALSSDASLARRACLYYGIVPLLSDQPTDVEQLLHLSKTTAKNLGVAASGDCIIILTAHPVGRPGGTQGLMVEKLA